MKEECLIKNAVNKKTGYIVDNISPIGNGASGSVYHVFFNNNNSIAVKISKHPELIKKEFEMDTIYITGHKNPDTDSIISAMAYAALKNALGQRQYRAARLGAVSDETKIVLDRFGFEPPMLINNVRTQVRDLDFDTPPMLSSSATISRAWQTMQQYKISTMPVINEDGSLYGMLSAGDVATYDMTSVRNPRMKNIPVFNLLSVLEGEILNEDPSMWDSVSGEVTVALPASRENLIFNSRDSIVICGDQPDMIRRAVELKVE